MNEKHLNVDEIVDLITDVSQKRKISCRDREKLKHLKNCKKCYELFGMVLAVNDAATSNVIDYTETIRESKKPVVAKGALSIVRVTRQEQQDINSFTIQQVDKMSALLNFEYSHTLTVQDNIVDINPHIFKFEERNESKTFIMFNTLNDRLVVQIYRKNLAVDKIGVYILCENKRIIELQMKKREDFIECFETDIPKENFKIYIDQI